jgi:hypothetical protein
MRNSRINRRIFQKSQISTNGRREEKFFDSQRVTYYFCGWSSTTNRRKSREACLRLSRNFQSIVGGHL